MEIKRNPYYIVRAAPKSPPKVVSCSSSTQNIILFIFTENNPESSKIP